MSSRIENSPIPKADQCRVVFLIAVWLGLLTGIGELVVLAVQKYVFGTYFWFAGLHLIWATPLAYLIAFSALGITLALATWFLPRLVTVRLAAFASSFVAFGSLLLMVGTVADYAVIALAIGLAFQASGLIARHYKRIIPLINLTRQVEIPSGLSLETKPSIPRRQFLLSAGSAGAAVAALAAGVAGSQALSEQLALNRLPVAKPPAPNVLFIVVDTVRAVNTSLLGYRRETTPRLAQLAKDGTVFSWAVSAAPWTLPSHSSMFTGHYCHELSADWAQPLDNTYQTLAEAFSANGYETAAFVGNYYYIDATSGLNRGFTHFEAIPLLPGQLVMDTAAGRKADLSPHLRIALNYYDDFGRKDATYITDSVVQWFSRRDSTRPFFTFLNYFDAHSPYLPPKPFDTAFGPTRPRNPRPGSAAIAWPPAEVKAELNAYDGSIAYLDQHVGLLIDQLRGRGLLQDTVIIVVGDHGEEFNEHGVMQHGRSVYLPAIHVPLLISFPPHVPSGRQIDVPVTLRDITSTIVDLAQLPNRDQFPGQSLTRFWATGSDKVAQEPSPLLSELNPSPWSLGGPSAKGPLKSLVVEHYHYIRNGDGTEEVYDILNDPWETRKLSRAGAEHPALQDFRTELQKALNPVNALDSSKGTG